MRSFDLRLRVAHILLLALGCVLSIALAACRGDDNKTADMTATVAPATSESGPRVINHTRPDLKVDFAPFENAGCPPENRICRADSDLYKLGCNSIRPVSELMGGLKPAFPIAVCQYDPNSRPELADKSTPPRSEYFYSTGGLLQQYVRYVVFKDNRLQLAKNPDEFRAVFGSVDSENEALAFALAMSRLYAQYGTTLDQKYTYETSAMEDTFVKATSDGYLVHLYDYQVFGCGPHYYYAVDVSVKRDGQTQEASRIKIYRDSKLDRLCVD